MTAVSRQVSIIEVGPRDGLQSEPEVLSTETKLEFIRRAIDAGIRRMEVTSFVHPKRCRRWPMPKKSSETCRTGMTSSISDWY